VTANVPDSPIFITLMMQAIRSSETPFLTRATRHNIPEDGILELVTVGYFKESMCSEVRFEVFTAVTMKNGVIGISSQRASVASYG
jgi:hypothetical protein